MGGFSFLHNSWTCRTFKAFILAVISLNTILYEAFLNNDSFMFIYFMVLLLQSRQCQYEAVEWRVLSRNIKKQKIYQIWVRININGLKSCRHLRHVSTVKQLFKWKTLVTNKTKIWLIHIYLYADTEYFYLHNQCPSKSWFLF